MAITSIGYDGSVNESQWAKLIPLAGSAHYGVSGANDWKVTSHATMDRGVNIASGTGWGHGVLDTSDSTVSLQGGSISSGSRWDCVVARRNWAGTGGATTFAMVAGTSSRAIPTRSVIPGTLDEQPIALVQFTAGQTAPTAIVDLRCWARNGGMMAKDDLALTYLKLPGAQILINGTQWNCELDSNGTPSWTTFVSGRIPLFGASPAGLGAAAISGGGENTQTLVNLGQNFLVQAGSSVNTTDSGGYARITFQKPFPNGLLTVMGFNGDDTSTGGSMTFASAGGVWGVEGFGTTTSWVYVARAQPASDDGTGSLIVSPDGGANRIHRINWIAIGW